MGEDLSTGAKIGIILIILCALLAIVLALLMMMKNITNQGSATLQSGLDQMLATRFTDYDQQTRTGTEVNAAIKLFEGQPVGVVVVTTNCVGGTTKGGYNYGALLEGYTKQSTAYDGDAYGSTTAITSHKESTDTYYTMAYATDSNGAVQYNWNTRPTSRSGSDTYVRSSAKFMSELIKDDTGTTIGICFTQVT